jgi:MATE family multidrug resistance protein
MVHQSCSASLEWFVRAVVPEEEDPMQDMALEERSLIERIDVRSVAHLAWPIMVSMLSYTLMGVVDTVFVGRLGTAQLAGVGLAIGVVHVTQAMGWGLMRGLKIAISQRVGAGELDAAGRLLWQGLWLAGLLGVSAAALGDLGMPVFQWMGGSPASMAHADHFTRIRLLGVPLMFAVMALSAHLHGRGETRTPMVATLLGNGVNILLDPVLIFGWLGLPAFGVSGAALATVIGMGASALYLLLQLRHVLWAADSGLSLSWLSEIWRVGAPLGVRGLLEVGSMMVFTAMLVQAGDAHLAAHVIVVRVISVSFLPGFALGEAASVLVGQAVGAQRPEQARQAWWVSVRLAIGVMSVMGLVFWLLPSALLSPFGATDEVLVVGAQLLLIAAVFQLFDAVAMVGLSVLNGAGDTRFTMVVTIFSAWLIKLPLGYVLAVPLGLGAAGAWWGLTADIVFLAAATLWRLQGDRWLSQRVAVAGTLVLAS